ncbi:hypothetical protein CF326_g6966 [Tilletia indica]|nr:hypothetical protein CF326_g6966 [Tilletia indica]
MQLNAGRGSNTTSAILEIARNDECDVLLVQEPGGFFRNGRTLPRILHSHYQVYLPLIADDVRPRVATYVRKNNFPWTPVAHTTMTEGNRDILILDLLAAGGQKVRLANVYNAPAGAEGSGEGAAAFLNLPEVDFPCLAAGDFNLYHDDWSAQWWAGPISAQAADLADFLSDNEWALGLEAGSITRPSSSGGSALDLVFMNRELDHQNWVTSCEVRPDLAAGSDHLPIVTSLRCGKGAPMERSLKFRFNRADWDKYRGALASTRDGRLEPHLTRLRRCSSPSLQPALIDALATAIQLWIFSSLEAAVPRTMTTGQGHPWWTEACSEATRQLATLEKELSASAASLPRIIDLPLLEAVERARATAKRTLASARKVYYRDRAEKIVGNDIFVARKWALGERQYASPALKDAEGRTHATPAEKRGLLRSTLLPDRDREDPLEILNHLPYGPPRATHHPITREELRNAVWTAPPDKAPGPDEITTRCLREGWDQISEPLYALAAAAFEAGWYPTPFKTSTLCALKKGGKRDPTLARSYRLIALLPVLGKALEKVAASRLTWYAETMRLVPVDQFGAMPKRCVTDAGVALTHDIHVGWSMPTRLTTSVLFFDVVGAFDNVDPGRMVRLLWAFGLPRPLVALLASWLSRRQAALRLDGATGPSLPCSTGLPQGSPLSMILFVLFLSPLWDTLPPGVRLFGYVDDGGLRVQGPTVEENCRALEEAYATSLEWAEANGLWFDSVKRELIHFPPTTRPPAELLPVSLGPTDADVVQPVARDTAVRWLGIWFSPTLTWEHHVRTVCAKARSAVGCLRMLANTVRGPSALLLRRAYVTCILTILTFAAPVWWRGTDRRVKDKTVHVRGSKTAAALLDAVQHQALRIILPVWKTTPVDALQCEASLPPLILVLNYLRDRYAIRLRTLPSHHPVTVRSHRRVPQSERSTLLQVRRTNQRASTPLLDLVKSTKGVERFRPGPTPPWSTSLPNERGFSHSLPDGRDRQAVAAAHTELTRTGSPALHVYTDGSMLTQGSTRKIGAAYVIYKWTSASRNLIYERSIHLHQDKEVFDAEVYALFCGTTTALAIASEQDVRRVMVFVDNAAAIQALTADARSNESSGALLASLRMRIRNWLREDQVRTLHVAWTPGHAGVEGNERADEKAKEGTSPLRATERLAKRTISLSTARRNAKDRLLGKWKKDWSSSALHPKYRRLRTQPPTLTPPPHLGTVSRKALGLWLQAKTGHGDFISYHQRDHINHPNARLHCRCGRVKTRFHPLHCVSYLSHHHLLDRARFPSGRLNYAVLFDHRTGISIFADYALRSKAYDCNHGF